MLMPEIWMIGSAIVGLALGFCLGLLWERRGATERYKKLKRTVVQETQAKNSVTQERNELRNKLKEAQDQAQKVIAAAKETHLKRIESLEKQLAQMHQLTQDLLKEAPAPQGSSGELDFAPTQPFDENKH